MGRTEGTSRCLWRETDTTFRIYIDDKVYNHKKHYIKSMEGRTKIIPMQNHLSTMISS